MDVNLAITHGTVSSGKIEMQPQVQRLVFVGQDLDFNVFSLASNQEIVRKLFLIAPDRYALSFYAVVELDARIISCGGRRW